MSYADQVITNDFLWTAISDAIAPLRKKRNGPWICINCPMCVVMGEQRADRRFRCGVRNEGGAIGVHCFNCPFRTKHRPGEPMTKRLKQFLLQLGTDELVVKRISYKLGQIASLVSSNPEMVSNLQLDVSMQFPPKDLPKGARPLLDWANEGCEDPNFIAVAEYLFGRGEELAASSIFYWSPSEEDNMMRRLIIPFIYEERIVGFTGRAIDDHVEPKYHSEVAKDFLFNSSILYERDREFILLVEGVLDAVAINGVSTLGAKINERQIAWLESFGKKIIVVPDRDKSGQRLIDIAVQRNWFVSFPALNATFASANWWEPDCKDSAEAVKRYRRLYTLTSIIQTSTDSNFQINVKRKMMV